MVANVFGGGGVEPVIARDPTGAAPTKPVSSTSSLFAASTVDQSTDTNEKSPPPVRRISTVSPTSPPWVLKKVASAEAGLPKTFWISQPSPTAVKVNPASWYGPLMSRRSMEAASKVMVAADDGATKSIRAMTSNMADLRK